MSRPEVQNTSRNPSPILVGLVSTLTIFGATSAAISDPGSAAQGVSIFATGAGGAFLTYELAPIIGEGVARSVGLFSKPIEQRVREFGRSMSAATSRATGGIFGNTKRPAINTETAATIVGAIPTMPEEDVEKGYQDSDTKQDDAAKEQTSPTRAPQPVRHITADKIRRIEVASKLDQSNAEIKGVGI